MILMFKMCPCSRRTAKEEEECGSYCGKCWDIIKKTRECVVCKIKVEEIRLYVSVSSKVPGCIRCYSNRDFPNIKLLKKFISIINIIITINTSPDSYCSVIS